MANESKNRVKLNKEYRRIGSISKTALAKVNEYFDKNENFWLVKSVHAERLADLERMTLVWEK